ncbi:hypothetical protein IB268_30160 [Achromobacter sp. ACM01]|uniref:hypothetical protein n=1 Tax=Achromobacter sp. ACM01 TaxID=2769298 RepID=UPI00177F4700|nr:hypothetical protein [Achromobacter sp. ACM01]MBD9477209.1 hypothetical protein [Achromobacter sp. ACM01]
MSHANIFQELHASRAGAHAIASTKPGVYTAREAEPEQFVGPTTFKQAAQRAAWWAVIATAWGAHPGHGSVAHINCGQGYAHVVHIEPSATQCDFFDCMYSAAMAMANQFDYEPAEPGCELFTCANGDIITNEIARVLGAVDARGTIAALVEDFKRSKVVMDLEKRVRELLPDLPALSHLAWA